MKCIIHVNRQHIAMNAKDGGRRPVFTIKQGSRTRYARAFSAPDVRGVSDQPPLACGARVWLECDSKGLVLIDEMTFKEARNAM